jgi:hypothetical protein
VSLELLLESGGILGGLNDNESVSGALLLGEVDVLTVQKISISLSSKNSLSQLSSMELERAYTESPSKSLRTLGPAR